MKTRFLIIIGFVFIISVLLYVFVMNVSGYCDLLLPLCTNFGGGSIDLDPDLSPSYAYDFMGGIFYHTILPIGGLSLGISALFLVPRFILKRKNIPSRPYMSLIASATMLFFGMSSLINGLEIVTLLMQEERLHSLDYVANLTAMVSIGFVLVLFGITILLKSKLIRTLLRMIK